MHISGFRRGSLGTSMVFDAIITLIFAQVIICQGACPDFWIPFQGSCYHLFSELEQWTQAQVMCTLNKANLAIIETAAENNFLKNQVKNTNDNGGVWLGASDVLNEGDFRWTGSNLPVTYTDWAPNQPNNFENNQNCLLFWLFSTWQWQDEICTLKTRFICEMRDPAVIG